MIELAAVAIPAATLAVGVWCGIRIERHRRDQDLDELMNDEPSVSARVRGS